VKLELFLLGADGMIIGSSAAMVDVGASGGAVATFMFQPELAIPVRSMKLQWSQPGG
jgi:hypothetical protein